MGALVGLAAIALASGRSEGAYRFVDVALVSNQPSLFEAGLFFGGGYFPDYPGADHYQARYLPLPFILYRGSFVRADERDGVRARVILADRVHLELSVSGSFPVNSKDNPARQGMPDLDWMGEIGPRLTFILTDPHADTRLKLLCPFRAVFSTDLASVKYRGYSVPPGLMLESYNFIRPRWRGIALLSATFTNRELNAYFYDVAPPFATPSRPFYDARAGYLGSDLVLGMMIPFQKNFRFFAGSQLAYREGAANVDSPLFKKSTGYSVFSGIAYTFYRSETKGKD